jgi:hypothetical protein
MLRLRTERNPAAILTLLDLSRRSLGFAGIGLLVWAVFGILAGFSGNYWTTPGQLWIWASLALAVIVVMAMTPMGRLYMNRVRAAVGVDAKSGAVDPNFTPDTRALDAAIASGQPGALAAIGLATIVILSWLMIMKPF